MSKIETVLRIINEICPFENIKADTELIDSEILSSLDILELVVDLNTEFDIRIDEELIVVENFATVETIVQKLLGKVEC